MIGFVRGFVLCFVCVCAYVRVCVAPASALGNELGPDSVTGTKPSCSTCGGACLHGGKCYQYGENGPKDAQECEKHNGDACGGSGSGDESGFYLPTVPTYRAYLPILPTYRAYLT